MKTKRRTKKKTVKALAPPPEQLSDVKKQFTFHHETNSTTQTYIRSHIVEKWIKQGVTGFEAGAARAISYMEYLWEAATCESLTASYGERISGGVGEGLDRHDAIKRIGDIQKEFPSAYWQIFENVVRNRHPAGKAASDLVGGSPKDASRAKLVVGMVASTIAIRLGY